MYDCLNADLDMARKRRFKKIVVKSILLFSGFFIINSVMAGIIITGSWSLSIGSTDLISGAGSDISNPFVSLANQVSIEVTDARPFRDDWRIDIHKSDAIWPAGFRLFVMRTGDGTGHNKATISGGLSYLEISDTDQLFFLGAGNRSGIPIQLKLEGVSVQIPPGLYSTTVIYTVTEY